MFRSKRNVIVKRLWKQRIPPNTVSNSSSSSSSNETPCPVESPEEFEVKSVVQCMLKRLKESQLELLVQAVESRGSENTGCVLVLKGDLHLGQWNAPPHVLCCQLWRWPDLQHTFEMKRLHWCDSASDPLYVCCNPYHWSRFFMPESPPPPYTRYPEELFSFEDRAPSEPISTETGSTGSASSSLQQWCTVAYWELRTRVGHLFPVHKTAVNIFSDLPHGDGLCLATLTQFNLTKNDSILKVREKIGQGVTICRDSDGVWVYNRSRHAIFVNSPTLDHPNTRMLTVYKVQPGYSINIFDFQKSKCYQRLQKLEILDGPFDPNAVRISFVKGWGPKYSRQFIMSCPCWLEVLLTVGR